MAALVVIDGRDAAAPQLRGWGRYARCLIDALAGGSPDGRHSRWWPTAGSGRSCCSSS